jgi:hypothetical protein
VGARGAVTSATNAWTTGDGGKIIRWNGTSWKPVTVPTGIAWLYGMAAISGTNAWAVGYGTSSSLTTPIVILHWNGTAWTKSA